MADDYVLSPPDYEATREVVNSYRHGQTNRRNPLTTNYGSSHSGAGQHPTRIRFRNDSAETIPAWGVIRINGADYANFGFLKAFKPDTSFQRLYLVNGPRPVAYVSSDKPTYGWGSFLTSETFRFADQYVLYDTGNTPAYGESWGPQNGTWTLKKYRYGFHILGGNITTESGKERTVAVQIPPEEIVVKNDSGGDYAANSSQTYKVFTGVAGSEADTGSTITGYNKTSVSFKNTKFGAAGWLHGNWYVTPWQS